jgi:hypothetical protein
MQTSKYIAEVKSIVSEANSGNHNGQEQQLPDTSQPVTEVDVYIEPDRITFIPKKATQEQVVESTPPASPPRKPSYPHIYALSVLYFVLLLSILILQIWLRLHPPIATITIIAKSQQQTVTGTLHLGRVIAPITVSQSQTVPTTGKGHQDARSAAGSITFYNGLFTSQSVAAGTTVTGSDGVQAVTTQDALIPAASPNPLAFGHVTVSAHIANAGSSGNIAAYDINEPCCGSGILAKNTAAFHGGANERDFTVVTQADINTVSTLLKTTLSESVIGALQAQVQPAEQVTMLPCTPTVTSDHQPGQEATQVKVTAGETCSAVAYNSQAVKENASDLLTRQAEQMLGTGYSRLGEIQVTVTQAAITQAKSPVISFTAQGTWVYGLDPTTQEQIKRLIAGKPKQEALHVLLSLPGIERASIAWENTKLPEDRAQIHIVMFVISKGWTP